jgi:RNA polymerase sigma-70 factor (ECF subfamily)
VPGSETRGGPRRIETDVRTDAELIRAARSDAAAFGELYERYARPIARWFAARTPERVVGELTAETFAQASLSLHRFRDEAGGSAAPWLYGIARNLLRRTLERERVETAARRRLGIPIQTYEADLDAVTERLDAERLGSALGSALEQLPSSQREALELRVVGALSYAEVATSLGCSEVAARIRVMRALDSLSRRLKGVLA